MNKYNYIQGWKLEIIAKILWKNKKSLQQQLWRNWKNIDDIEFIKELILKLKD